MRDFQSLRPKILNFVFNLRFFFFAIIFLVNPLKCLAISTEDSKEFSEVQPFPPSRRKAAHGRRNLQNYPDTMGWNSTDACSLCVCYNRKQKMHVDCTVAAVPVKSLPTNIPANTSRLWLQGQHLTDIGITNILPPLPMLRELFLNGNPITNISLDAFQNVRHLRTLLLHYTLITELPDGLFDDMVHLRNLWANHALITAIGPEVFHGLTKLETLYLQGNHISNFSPGQFYGLPNMKALDITKQRGNSTLYPTCCDFCGVNPSAVSFDDSNYTALTSIGNDDYNSANSNAALKCGNITPFLDHCMQPLNHKCRQVVRAPSYVRWRTSQGGLRALPSAVFTLQALLHLLTVD